MNRVKRFATRLVVAVVCAVWMFHFAWREIDSDTDVPWPWEGRDE